MSASERKRELRRRRHRKQKVAVFARKAAKASVSEKQNIATKLRMLTPGAEAVIERLDLGTRG